MNAIRNKSRKGFTLVEILIVVIILGILAAIVIPQFTNASQDARRSALASTVQSVRSQIELYKLQHGDTLPPLTGGDWSALTVASVYPAGSTNSFGPYMQSVPENQLTSSTLIQIGDAGATPVATNGFVYDYGTVTAPGSGKFWGIDKNAAGTLSLLGD